jgi:hypothetical protein
MADLAWLKTRWCIIVLPDVLTEAQAASLWGSSLSKRTECRLSMHDRGDVASDGCDAIFRVVEESGSPQASGDGSVKSPEQSKDCQTKRG